MKVFKFGGASVKDASAIRNLAQIAEKENNPLVIIVSAIGKTTNALEVLHELAFNKKSFSEEFSSLENLHNEIIIDLFKKKSSSITVLFSDLRTILDECSRYSKDFTYAQIVAFGELISTTIISEYLNFSNQNNSWFDARKCIQPG